MLGALRSASDGASGRERTSRLIELGSAWRLLRLIVVVVCLLAVGVSAAAGAAPSTPTAPTPDTEITPTPKNGCDSGWSQVAGDVFGAQGCGGYKQADSPVPPTVDFFSVAFYDDHTGLAAGAACKTDPPSPVPTGFDLDAFLRDCPRAPVLYRYTPGETTAWQRMELPGADQGFVGAIAWIGKDRALAVGGTGVYPRREQATGDAQPDRTGAGLAWLYDHGRWTQVDVSKQQTSDSPPRPLGGLTALDCTPRPETDGELCFAGGYRQLWKWQDGQFSRSWTDADVGTTFRFRVTGIRFLPGQGPAPDDPQHIEALATTAGCCDATPANDSPSVLAFNGTNWSTSPIQNSIFGIPYPSQAPVPDSYYSPVVSGQPGNYLFSVVQTSGRPPPVAGAPEPASVIAGPFQVPANNNPPNNSPTTTNYATTSDVRLVAGDGDLTGTQQPSDVVALATQTQAGIVTLGAASDPTQPDGIMDWAVGSFLSSGQGAAVTTTARGSLTPSPVTCPGGTLSGSCTPDPNGVSGQAASRSVFALPTYALNGFRMVGQTGIGWAVGDRGAIMSLGGGGGSLAGGREPTPGASTTGTPGSWPDTQAYDALRPAGSLQAGAVPPLAAQPRQSLAPEFVAGGTPDYTGDAGGKLKTASSIAMSRDGREGWAVGPGSAASVRFTGDATTIYHYDGSTWRDCDPEGVPSVLPADPACASIVALRHHTDYFTHKQHPVELNYVARVPADNGGADDFVAVGGPYSADGLDVVLRYSAKDQRWSVNDTAAQQIYNTNPGGLSAVAFTAPNDGWIVGWSTGSPQLSHFDGHQWTHCIQGSAKTDPGCDSPDNRIINLSGQFALAAVGKRVYLYGTRVEANASGAITQANPRFPVILYHDAGKPCTADDRSGCWRADHSQGGLDPKGDNPSDESAADQGQIFALSVVQRAEDGGFEGWASGSFDTSTPAALLHLASTRSGGQWTKWSENGALADYGFPVSQGNGTRPQLLALPGGRALFQSGLGRPLLGFDPVKQRWDVAPTPFPLVTGRFNDHFQAALGGSNFYSSGELIVADGHGGAWIAVKGATVNRFHDAFYDYTAQPPRPVFDDVAHPIRTQIMAAAGGGDGSLWVATNGGRLYRYDRITGWDSLQVPGWDAGRVVTSPSAADAIAIGPDGSGVMVGKGGRIADVTRSSAVLDPAVGSLCSVSNAPPCGTGRELRSAAVAPDGSAMVGGDGLSLLWRPAGGAFRAIDKPPALSSSRVTGLSLPRSDRAYLATDTGTIFTGERAGESWHWSPSAENDTPAGALLSGQGGHQAPLAIRAIAVDTSGHGFAVGDRGLILERLGDGAHPWRRHATGLWDDLHSVSLPVTGQNGGALVGGSNGLVLTLVGDRFEVAHQADPYDPVNGGAGPDSQPGGVVVGVALLAGVTSGQAEAWAAIQNQDVADRGSVTSSLLHYSSDRSETLLSPSRRIAPLPDSPSARSGEVSFTAFGKSECQFTPPATCPELTGTNYVSEQIQSRIGGDIADRAGMPGGPAFSVYTGDVNDEAGPATPQHVKGAPDAGQGAFTGAVSVGGSPTDPSANHRRWAELVARPLLNAHVPVFAAVGHQDLSSSSVCYGSGNICGDTHGTSPVGANLAWRQTFTSMPEPWGTSSAAESGSLKFVPAGQSSRTPDTTVTSPTDGSTTSVPTGGASTHYAFDVQRGGTHVVRVVFLDTSLKSLAAGDAVQQPAEQQIAWLKSVLCQHGQETTPLDHCRYPNEQAIVVSETPTYSYGPGASTDTQTDSTALETLLSQYKANLVVSGRLGWNGLYWTVAPGLHTPCAGSDYPDATNVPAGGSIPACAAASNGPSTPDSAGQLAGSLTSIAAPPPPAHCSGSGSNESGVIPNVVAASAGGKFGPDGQSTGSADRQGFFHGYTIIRLDQSGDPRCTLVEQRPIFDWVGITAVAHALRPGQHMTLKGYGREPVGLDQPIRYDDINGFAITHRYDLVAADPNRPWLPKVDAALIDPQSNPNGYVPLSADCSIACIDRQTGNIQTGKGAHPRVYAIGILSVGAKAASWPIVFEPRRSFRAPALPALKAPIIPLPRVLAAPATSLPSVQPPPNPPPLNFTFPNPPQVPSLPPLSAPAVRPPTPPVPPPPPANAAANTLSIAPAAVGLNVAPPATVIPPPAPPIQPAPPGGARREARQRQAAAAKSEEGAQDAKEAGVDLAEGPPGSQAAQMTRRDRVKPGPSITTIAHHDQPSAWSRGALYGGGLTLMAITLALGFTTLRPGPRGRRRSPDLPAPAYARTWRQRH